MPPVDALFIATSAVCVAGHSVIDVSKETGIVSQLVLLLLIQIGGLGIMTGMMFMSLIVSRRGGIKGRIFSLGGFGVDASAALVAEIADKISAAAQMDAADESSLIKTGAKEADVAIVTIGAAVEPSVLSTSLLVELGVPLVMARACSKLRARVLERVVAHRVIFPERDMGARIG